MMSKMETSLTNLLCHLSLCCLPVETACSLFATISLLLSGIGVFTLLGLGTLAHTMLTESDFDTWPEPWDESSGIDAAVYIFVLFLHIFTISSFVFSAVLCYGTQTRRCGFLKAYMAYGAVMTTFVTMGIIYCYCTSWLLTDEGCFIGFIASCIYLRLLFMVQQTHELFRAAKARDQAQLLPLCRGKAA